MKVAALYIDPRGPYPSLLGPEMCWDEARDARTYAGPWPVVAHPPCSPWSKSSHLSSRPQDRELFRFALEAVRRFGGVIEQPAYSRAFMAHGVNPIMQVSQCDFGHPARKKTWLYFEPVNLLPPPLPAHREPTHWCSGGRTKSSREGSPVPPGIKVCSAQQRRRTPPDFARWLIALASQAHRP